MYKTHAAPLRNGRRVQKLINLLSLAFLALFLVSYQPFIKISIETRLEGELKELSAPKLLDSAAKAHQLRKFLYPNLTIFDLKVQYLINNDVCSHFDAAHLHQKPKPILAINVIQCGSDYKEARDAIRQSMPSSELDRLNIKRLFFLARPNPHKKTTRMFIKDLILENEEHRDLVVGDFIDHYRNLTYKTIMFLDWTTRFCPQAQFVIKSDDDILVDLYQLSNLFQQASVPFARTPTSKNPVQQRADPVSHKFVSDIRQKLYNASDSRFIMGGVSTSLQVEREKSHRFFVSYDQYPNETWPVYATGIGFLTTIKTVKDLVKMSRRVPFFWIEDVYVTGMLREKLGIEFLSLDTLSTTGMNDMVCCSPNVLLDSTHPDIQLDYFVSKKYGAGETSPVRDFLQPKWCHFLLGQAQYENPELLKNFHRHAKFCYDTQSCFRPSFGEQLEVCNGLFYPSS